MRETTTTKPKDLGMFTDEGNLALTNALLDALRVPAHEFPTDMEAWWFAEEWLTTQPEHTEALHGHDEWRDTDVRDMIGWVLENPRRGWKWLLS